MREITKSARTFVTRHTVRPVRHLVLCRDADVDDDQPIIYPTAASIADALRAEVSDLPSGTPGAMQLADGTPVSTVMWHTDDRSAPGLPAQQTLERLACAALLAAYPDRGLAIANWLTARPAPPPDSPKAFAWSHMAGWYAEYGCEAFYSQLWEDPLVLPHLRSRLESCGAWRIAALLAQQ
ncbi:MAG: hypothetical protein HYU66_11715 [Armatimonadetes bacterium]|nr:hypothetical protein [Armatimonadota bacterium]